MKDRFGLKTDTIQKINQVLAAYPQVEQAILYGSRAKGNYKNGSDIDLVLSGDGELTLKLFYQIANDLDDLLLPYTIDLSILSDIHDPDLLGHIQHVGKLFYKKGEMLLSPL